MHLRTALCIILLCMSWPLIGARAAPPSLMVTLLSPADGTEFSYGTNVYTSGTLAAVVSLGAVPVDSANVTFYVDGQVVGWSLSDASGYSACCGEFSLSTPYFPPYSPLSRDIAPGSHDWYARAEKQPYNPAISTTFRFIHDPALCGIHDTAPPDGDPHCTPTNGALDLYLFQVDLSETPDKKSFFFQSWWYYKFGTDVNLTVLQNLYLDGAFNPIGCEKYGNDAWGSMGITVPASQGVHEARYVLNEPNQINPPNYPCNNIRNTETNYYNDEIWTGIYTDSTSGFWISPYRHPILSSNPFAPAIMGDSPAYHVITPGQTTVFLFSLGSLYGSPPQVTLTASGLPSDASYSFQPTTLTLPGNAYQPNSIATLVVAAGNTAGIFPVTITASFGSTLISTRVILQILPAIITFATIPSTFAGATTPGTITACGATFNNGQFSENCGGRFSATANLPSPSSGWQFDHWESTGVVNCVSATTNPTSCSTSAGAGSLTAVYATQVTFGSALISWGSCANSPEPMGATILSLVGSVPACYVPTGYSISNWSCSGGLSCSGSSNVVLVSIGGPGTITMNFKTGSLTNPVSTSLTASATPSSMHGGTTFTVSGSLTANGVGVSGETVVLVFGWDSNIVTVTTQSGGSYTYTATAPSRVGSYDVHAFFLGDYAGNPQYLPSTATAKITVN